MGGGGSKGGYGMDEIKPVEIPAPLPTKNDEGISINKVAAVQNAVVNSGNTGQGLAVDNGAFATEAKIKPAVQKNSLASLGDSAVSPAISTNVPKVQALATPQPLPVQESLKPLPEEEESGFGAIVKAKEEVPQMSISLNTSDKATQHVQGKIAENPFMNVDASKIKTPVQSVLQNPLVAQTPALQDAFSVTPKPQAPQANIFAVEEGSKKMGLYGNAQDVAEGLAKTELKHKQKEKTIDKSAVSIELQNITQEQMTHWDSKSAVSFKYIENSTLAKARSRIIHEPLGSFENLMSNFREGENDSTTGILNAQKQNMYGANKEIKTTESKARNFYETASYELGKIYGDKYFYYIEAGGAVIGGAIGSLAGPAGTAVGAYVGAAVTSAMLGVYNDYLVANVNGKTFTSDDFMESVQVNALSSALGGTAGKLVGRLGKNLTKKGVSELQNYLDEVIEYLTSSLSTSGVKSQLQNKKVKE